MTKSDPGSLDGLVLRFRETMEGHVGIDEREPLAAPREGSGRALPSSFDVEIRIEDLGRFLRVADHAAQLSGTVTFEPAGGRLPIRDGVFNLFTVDPGPNPPDDLRVPLHAGTASRTSFTGTRRSTTIGCARCGAGHDHALHHLYRGPDEHAPYMPRGCSRST